MSQGQSKLVSEVTHNRRHGILYGRTGHILGGIFREVFCWVVERVDGKSVLSHPIFHPVRFHAIEREVKYILNRYHPCHSCIYHPKGEDGTLQDYSEFLPCAVNPLNYGIPNCPDREVP